MITVFIGGSSRELGAITDGWIKEQIERRRGDNVAVCVRVEIRCRLANMTLSTPGCGGHGGGGRPPNSVEQRVFDLWDAWKLNTAGFSAGNLIGFLKRAEEMAC
jgi:hypothetical protein